MNSQITLPVSELKEALPGFSKVIGRRSTLPVLDTIKVVRDGKGTVSLQATDLDSFVTYHARETGPVMEVLVPFEPLNKIVKGCSADDNVTITVEAKNKVRLRYAISGSPVDQNLATLPVQDFPPAPAITAKPVVLEKAFGPVLRQALDCSSDDPARYVINGACLDVTDKKFHYVVGTNGRILFAANSFCFDLKQSVIIPNRKFVSWNGFLTDSEALLTIQPGKKKEGGWVQLQSAQWTFITKEIEGNYPNWKQVVVAPDSRWTEVKFSEAALQQLLQVTPKLPGNYDPNYPIRLRVTTGLCLEGQNKDENEWTSIPINGVKVVGNPVQVRLNREYLLKAVRCGLDTLFIEDELTPVLFTATGRKMIIMPLKPDNTPASAPAPVKPVPPSSEAKPQPSNPTETTTNERKNTMPRGVRSTTTTTAPAVTPGHNGNGNGNGNAIKSLHDHLEQIKDSLKGVVRELNGVQETLKLAEKEKRTTEREINGIRTQLRKIQTVTI